MGMNVGEMRQRLEHPTNIFHGAYIQSRSRGSVADIHLVLPAKAFSRATLSFRPPLHILESLWQLYQHNDKCPLSERQRFDEARSLLVAHRDTYIALQLPGLQNCTYTLEITPTFRDDIYLKHPVTGKIDLHQYPYGDLPRFRLRTAHVAMVAKHTARHVIVADLADSYLDIAYEICNFCNNMAWPRRIEPPERSIRCPTIPPSCKRKAPKDISDRAPPIKRPRDAAAALLPLPVNTPVECASFNPNPRTRKRRTSCYSESAMTPPAKRSRTQMAVANRCLPTTLAGKEETMVGRPSRELRPSRAAKTLAVVRIGKVT